MTMPVLMFYFFEIAAALSAIALVFVRQVFYGALLLMVTLLALAGIYVLATAEFVAITQILVYAGGIVVLMLFGIMLTSKISGKALVVENTLVTSGVLVGLLFFGTMAYTIGTAALPAPAPAVAQPMPHIGAVGVAIMTDGFVPFELAGVLLLMALVGAAVVASNSKSRKM